MEVTFKQIKDISLNHGRDDICLAISDGITNKGASFYLDAALRIKHFLGQICIESGFFSIIDESLNYRADRLVEVWPTHFNAKNASAYAGQPQKLANFIYSMAIHPDLGNTGPNDGWLYRGGSLVQLTGKANYAEFNIWMKANVPGAPDFLAHPELIRTVEWCMYPALWFWASKGCYKFADQDDDKGVTRAINGGLTDYSNRSKATALAGKILNMPTQAAPVSTKPTQPDPLLKEYQGKLNLVSQMLKRPDFNVGNPDGWNGPKTNGAVRAFQNYATLDVVGTLGPNTRSAIDRLLAAKG